MTALYIGEVSRFSRSAPHSAKTPSITIKFVTWLQGTLHSSPKRLIPFRLCFVALRPNSQITFRLFTIAAYSFDKSFIIIFFAGFKIKENDKI